MDKTFDESSSVDLRGANIPFRAKSLVIFNQSNQWLRIGAYGYVNPYTLNAVIGVPGVETFDITREAPATEVQPTTITGEKYYVTATDAALIPSPGTLYGPSANTVNLFIASTILQNNLASPGAGTFAHILSVSTQGQAEHLGGVKRLLLKARDANLATVFVQVSASDLVANPSATALELNAGESVVLAYPWLGPSPYVVNNGLGYLQLWFVGAAPDSVDYVILI